MRSAILIFLAILAVATTPARAQGTWVETRFARAICGGGAAPVASTDGLAKRLKLTDRQKVALKDLADASASADASAKKALCADKPDLSTTPGRMAFASPLPQPLNDAYRRGGVAECHPRRHATWSKQGRQSGLRISAQTSGSNLTIGALV